MKLGKRLLNLVLVATLLCSSLLLGACGNGAGSTEDAGGKKAYSVAVKDALGNPYTEGIVVQYHQNGAMVAMQIVNPQTGVATKELDAGDYTVKLQFTDGPDGYYYVEEGLTLSATKTELEVILAKAITAEATTLYVGDGSYDAYVVGTGCTHVELEAGERNYFLFTPTEDGTYELKYYISSDGMSQSAVTHTDKYVSRNELVLDQAVINVNGDFIYKDVIYPHEKSVGEIVTDERREASEHKIVDIVKKFNVELTILNGEIRYKGE